MFPYVGISDVWHSYWKVLKNGTFVTLSVSGTCGLFMIVSILIQMTKYLQLQFHISPSRASLLVGKWRSKYFCNLNWFIFGIFLSVEDIRNDMSWSISKFCHIFFIYKFSRNSTQRDHWNPCFTPLQILVNIVGVRQNNEIKIKMCKVYITFKSSLQIVSATFLNFKWSANTGVIFALVLWLKSREQHGTLKRLIYKIFSIQSVGQRLFPLFYCRAQWVGIEHQWSVTVGILNEKI